ncbi:hypothetical protein [Kingella sp. (in: b-proteobacteria)]|uniref:hypothetical protein n=1 Tax=Kingella sp. (in: b-proteobacteria) TaxID=2020713 RepID=UPI0026DA72DC|nr:hypothetical protein [Kingella sp. (in: b-proteobacteria)]MDO4657704.1 hypothetical protein [Kingella sp. (in: b-proteobacteria)]
MNVGCVEMVLTSLKLSLLVFRLPMGNMGSLKFLHRAQSISCSCKQEYARGLFFRLPVFTTVSIKAA